ncbi:MAG: CotH kinase family protein [Candidatus Omnitrophota bacterium]
MKYFFHMAAIFFFSASLSYAADNIVINEIHYNPPDDGPEEFIELFNPTKTSVDLSGYAFTNGVAYTFPASTAIPAGGYLLVAKNLSLSAWRELAKVGPYNGNLANSGERLTLRAPDGRIVDNFAYNDALLWPRGADGYGSSLERISPDLSSEDFHSWRASLTKSGTPGRQNSVFGTPPKPVILAYRIRPQHPTSQDAVDIEIDLDAVDQIRKAVLLVETAATVSSGQSYSLTLSAPDAGSGSIAFKAQIPAQRSQTLVRFGVNITLTNGSTLRLPHVSEPHPYESYFVYDGEIPSKLPLLWLFNSLSSSIPSTARKYSAAVIQMLDGRPQVYDGVSLIAARNGQKVKFLKGEEHRGDRTINLNLESPSPGTTAGPQSPHAEHISYQLFRDFGALAERCEWYRVIDKGNHYQRIAYQQPNEKFLEMNGRDPSGNLYKIAYNEPGGYTKMTNLDSGDEDYRELFQHITPSNRRTLSQDLRHYLAIDEVMGYEVATFLLSHWDGFKNNIFLYHNPPPLDQWEIIPWDVDKTFGYTDSDPMFWKMPIDFPITGIAPGSPELTGRNLVGVIGRPFHMDADLHREFVQKVREALDGLFSLDRVNGMIQEAETLLNQDLDLLEQYLGRPRNDRRNQIKTSYDTLRRFLRLRHEFLRTQFPASFVASRQIPSLDYHAGSTLAGIRLTITAVEGQTVSASVVENLPAGFAASHIQATLGEVAKTGNVIAWKLSNLTGEASLTYDLTAPAANPPMSVDITGSITVNGTVYSSGTSTLKYMPENMRSLGQDWAIGSGGSWYIADGVLNCYSDSSFDPKHVWVDKDFGTGDYIVQADVRMVDWQDGDLARSGVAVRINPSDGERGLNLLLHNDYGSVDVLNDLIAWGTNGSYQWQTGEWYSMTLQCRNNHLEGSIKKKDSADTPYAISWDDARFEQRSPGFPGLTGSTMNGLTSQFDNFKVLVNGKVVFSDDFEIHTGESDWQLY